MHPHGDGRGDFAWPRPKDHTIHSSVLREVFGEVDHRFVNHTRVFGDEHRFELLGRQIKAEKQWGSLFARHDGVQDAWLKEQKGLLLSCVNVHHLYFSIFYPVVLPGRISYCRLRNGGDQLLISVLAAVVSSGQGEE